MDVVGTTFEPGATPEEWEARLRSFATTHVGVGELERLRLALQAAVDQAAYMSDRFATILLLDEIEGLTSVETGFGELASDIDRLLSGKPVSRLHVDFWPFTYSVSRLIAEAASARLRTRTGRATTN
jgi:hypothetical protein